MVLHNRSSLESDQVAQGNNSREKSGLVRAIVRAAIQEVALVRFKGQGAIPGKKLGKYKERSLRGRGRKGTRRRVALGYRVAEGNQFRGCREVRLPSIEPLGKMENRAD